SELARAPASRLALPLSQWSHGPGFLFALGRVLPNALFDRDTASLIVAWLSALALAWAGVDLVRWAARGRKSWAVMGAGWAFLGTHLGFYSVAYSSELFGHTALAVAARWVLIPRRWRWFDAGVLGVAGRR